MAKQMIKTLSMLMLLAVVALATTAVSAQTVRRVVANVPFSFIVGDKEMPAGTYGVQATSSGSGILRISGTENAKSIVRLSSSLHRNSSNGKGKLVFHRYGDQYFLSEIWSAGETDGRQLMKSSREKTLQREQLASNQGKQAYQTIEVMVVGQ